MSHGLPTGALDGARVVHVHDRVPDAVYVGRAVRATNLPQSPFANPFVVGGRYSFTGDRRATPVSVVTGYARRFAVRPDLWRLLPELRGKPLACWCRHDGEPLVEGRNNCHGDVLLQWLSQYTDDELRRMAEEAEGGQDRVR